MARPTHETVARVGQPATVQSIVRRSLRTGDKKPFEVAVYRPHSLTPVRKIVNIITLEHAIGIADALWADPDGEVPTPEQARQTAEANR